MSRNVGHWYNSMIGTILLHGCISFRLRAGNHIDQDKLKTYQLLFGVVCVAPLRGRLFVAHDVYVV